MGHAVPVEVVLVQPNTDDMAAVLDLADAHRGTLGHMPWGALRLFAEQGRILAAKIDGEIAGYTLYDVARERVRIIHLCVAAEFRSRKVARALTDDLSDRHRELRGVFLKCRRDFPANQMWPALGFELRAEVPGRGKESKPLCCWWRSHGHPDLFSEGVGDAETLVAIDHNVFLDLITDRPGTGPEEARVLDSDWLRGSIGLAITRETHNEIDKNPSADERARQRSVLGRFLELDYPPGRESEVRQAFDKRIPAEQVPPEDKADVRHIISAAAGGARILVTRDEKMIGRYAEAAAETLGLRVLRPSDLVAHQDEVTSAARYRPVELQGTAYRVSDCGAETEPALMDFLDNAGGERKSGFKALLRELASDPNTHRRWVRDPAGRALAVWATRVEHEERALVVPLLRVHVHEATGVTIGRKLLQSIKTEALKAGADRIWITDPHLHRGFVSDLEDDGFFQADDPQKRVAAVLDARSSTEAIAQLRGHPLEQRASAAITEATRPAQVAVLERQLWPLKLLDRDVSNVVIPIEPHYADRLLAFRQTLLERPAELGLGRELVYYRTPRGNPAVRSRIAWYASRSGADRVSAVVGVSRLVSVDVDRPERLHRRNSQLGVWDLPDIRQSAREGHASALRFADTELFVRPVLFERLKERAERSSKRLGTLQSPTVIDSQVFSWLYREGTGRAV